jgi:hypothetical protein
MEGYTIETTYQAAKHPEDAPAQRQPVPLSVHKEDITKLDLPSKVKAQVFAEQMPLEVRLDE